jgi:hypothetical protein
MSKTKRENKTHPKGYGRGLRLVRRNGVVLRVKTTRSAMIAKGLQVPLELPIFTAESY